MLRLHYSNRLEKLVPPLADEVEKLQRRDPLARATVIVPNRAVEEFLKLRLAERIGVAANLDFPFLRSCLAGALSRAEPDLRVLDADDLEFAIFECLKRVLTEHDNAFEPVRRYLAAFGSSSEREIRLFQLSERVARLFHEYSILRSAMLTQWRRGKSVERESFAQAERWQRALYGKLFATDGTLKPQWLNASDHRWMLLPDAVAATDPNRIATAIGDTLHVFGLSYVGPEFIRIFASLGRLERLDLHIYALNPCGEFWEDVASVTGARAGLARRGEKLGTPLDATDDPFGLVSAVDNRALQFWGRPGREHIRLLNELADCDFDAHFADPAANADGPTLLRQLQSSILNRRPNPEPRPAGAGALDDGSVRFLACPGIRREIEIVANAICQLICEDEKSAGADRFRFHQMAVLLPDAEAEAYLPHIEAVLGAQYRIPINVANPRLNAESRVGEAVELLLKLPDGRFSREEVIHLLTHPAICGGVVASDPEQWQAWCRSLGIFFGADAHDFDETYLADDVFHWDQALKRLALGVFMVGEPGGVARSFKAQPGCEYLPYETAPQSASSVAGMLNLARRLLADALNIRTARLNPSEWAELLSGFVGAYVRPEDASDERVLDNCVSALASLDRPELRVSPVPYEVARDLALKRIRGAESLQCRYAERGVAIGSLSALRSIPFRAIFMLGLGEASFPERERRDPLDLRLIRRQAGDVSATERDRYLFLETLLAARDRIFFSWICRDPRTGDPLEPSSPVRELQFILRGWVDEATLADVMTAKHPVSRYDLRYFPDLPQENDIKRHPEMVSFDPQARRGARMSAMRAALKECCGDANLPGRNEGLIEKLADEVRPTLKKTLRVIEPARRRTVDEEGEIILPIAALRNFLQCPLQGAARYALGIADEGENAREDDQDEPLEEPVIERTILLREAFWLGRGQLAQVKSEYERAFRIYQLRGDAPVGPFAEVAKETDLGKLKLCIEQVRSAGIRDFDGWEQIQFGAAREFANVDRKMDALSLDIGMAGDQARRRVKLHGIVGPISGRLGMSFRCISGGGARTHNFLDGFLGAIVLAAAGEKTPREFVVAVLGGEEDAGKPDKFTRRLEVPSGDDARKYLSGLVEDLLSGNNHYFLPLEAVEKIVKSPGHSPAEIALGIRNNDYSSCRSDHGPVRNPRHFDPPSDREIEAIIERRFRPIERIFKSES